MGYIEYTQNRHKKAAALFKEALDGARAADDARSTAEALTWLGEVQLARGKHEEAEQFLLEAVDAHASVWNDRGRAHSLDCLGSVFQAISDHDRAIELHEEAIFIYQAAKDDVGRANSLNGLARAYHALGRRVEAITSFRTARDIFSREENDMGLADSLAGLGESLRLQGQCSEAAECLFTAKHLYSRLGNYQGMAASLCSLGAAYNALSNFIEAEEVFIEVITAFIHVLDRDGRKRALDGLKEARCGRGTPQTEADSLELCSEALERYQEESKAKLGSAILDSVTVADAMYMLGSVFLQRGDDQTAEDYLLQARDRYQAISLIKIPHLTAAWLSLGDLYSARSDYVQAEEAFVRAVDLSVYLPTRDYLRKAVQGFERTIKSQNPNAHVEQEIQEHLDHIYLTTSISLSTFNLHSGLDLRLRAETSSLLGNIFLQKDRMELADIHFRRAQECWRKAGDDSGLAYILNKLGHITDARQDPREAEILFLEAATLNICLWNKAGLKEALEGMTTARRKALAGLNELVEIDDLLNQATQSSDGEEERFFADASLVIGSIFMCKGELASAEEFLGLALEGYNAVDNYRGIASTLVRLGWMFSHFQNSPDSADRLLDLAREVFVRLGDEAGFTLAITRLNKEVTKTTFLSG